MKQLLNLSIIVFVLFVSACANFKKRSNNDMVVHFNGACGWCAGSDSMYLNKSVETYSKPPVCNFKGVAYEYPAAPKNWEALVETFDMSKFKQIEMNTCAVCVDGCDDWVTVRQGNDVHTIRYSDIEHEALLPIKPFLEKLRSIREIYRKRLPVISRE